jgi:hypothetical protein
MATIKIVCCLRNDPQNDHLRWGADTALLGADRYDPNVLWSTISNLLDLNKGKLPANARVEHRRLAPRYPVSMPAKVAIFRRSDPQDLSWGHAMLRNISLTGAFLDDIRLEAQSIPAEPFRLMLEIEEDPFKNWKARCQVVRLSSNGVLSAGVRFEELEEESRRQIALVASA